MPNVDFQQLPLIILGGTFDPVHNGHMQVADYLFNQLNCPITFMPTGKQNYKAPPQASKEDRLVMLKLALANNPQYAINTLEIDSNKICCTSTTLIQLRTILGSTLPIFFVLGEDSLLSLDTWDNWQILPELANFIVVKRAGFATAEHVAKEQHNPVIQLLHQEKRIGDLNDLRMDNHHPPAHGKFYLTEFTPQDVSSTMIRSFVTQQRQIDHLLPVAVAKYIATAKLYLTF